MLEGTPIPQEYNLDIQFEGKSELGLKFWDIQGGLIFQEPASTQLNTLLIRSRVIINVLDASVLMAGDEILSLEINGHQRVRQLLMGIGDNQPRLVIFVLTKCEHWIDEPSLSKLIKKFEERHSQVLQLLGSSWNLVAKFPPERVGVCHSRRGFGCGSSRRRESRGRRI